VIATQINNHVQQALNRLLQQYQGLPNITGLLTALVTQIQDIENGLYPVDQYRQLAYAFGIQLDNLGTIIGIPRNGLPDSEYFVLLLGEIAQNNSDTTAPTMLNIVQTLFQASNVFIKQPQSSGSHPLDPVKPAWVAFGVGGATTPSTLYGVVEQIIENSIGAAISLVYIATYDANYGFAFAGDNGGGGFSDLNNPLPTDGLWASLIFNNPVQ
jgi:hypothetical protein